MFSCCVFGFRPHCVFLFCFVVCFLALGYAADCHTPAQITQTLSHIKTPSCEVDDKQPKLLLIIFNITLVERWAKQGFTIHFLPLICISNIMPGPHFLCWRFLGSSIHMMWLKQFYSFYDCVEVDSLVIARALIHLHQNLHKLTGL